MPENADPETPVWVLNGPNLNRLGTRQPEIYGRTTYAELAEQCRAWGRADGLSVRVEQTNDEATLLEWLHSAADDQVPVVLNPAAWTHTSVALGDACAMLTAPLIEVHLSNPHAREEYRHRSFVSAYATGTITGFGVASYRLALSAIAGLVHRA